MNSEINICCICFEHLKSKIIKCAQCRQIIHKSCWETWIEHNNTCPHCRFENVIKLKFLKKNTYHQDIDIKYNLLRHHKLTTENLKIKRFFSKIFQKKDGKIFDLIFSNNKKNFEIKDKHYKILEINDRFVKEMNFKIQRSSRYSSISIISSDNYISIYISNSKITTQFIFKANQNINILKKYLKFTH